MKTRLFLFAGLILAFTITTTSCTKTVTEEVIEEVCSDEEKMAAVVAFFNPFDQTIYLLPSFRESAGHALDLYPSSDGNDRYTYQAFTLGGNPIPVSVALKEAPLDTLLSLRTAIHNELEYLADMPGAEEELISASTTRDGYYCKKIDDERTTRCHVFPGYSTSTYHYDRYICVRGRYDQTCTEWFGVVGYSYRYNNENCAGTPKRSSINATTCR